jgi:hypothetical protein
MTQPCLPFGQTLADQFESFHQANPKVYVVLVRLAREWIKRTGRHKIGIGALFERARWEIAIETSDPEFKLNNNFRSFYARLIMADNEDLGDIFNLRSSEADQWINEHLMKAAS